MADEDDSSKTEDPTEKKLAKGREEGQVASSQEVKSWMILMGGTFGIMLLAPTMMIKLQREMVPLISEAHAVAMDFEHVRLVFARLTIETGIALAPFVGLLLLMALSSNILQTGLVYSPKKIEPKLSRISLLAGFKRLFSMKAIVEFIKGIVKISIVSVVSFSLALPYLEDFDLLFGAEIIQILDRLYIVALLLMAGSVGVMTAIAILDYMYQKFEFIKQMKMTHNDVKDEHKQSEGDPLIKSRIRKIRMERAQARMMAAVPRADVIVTNPTHYAIALEYKMDSMSAPRLVAKGADFVAQRIRERAEELEIPIVENPPLARALYATVELEEEVPPEHYKAVAEVIGYVMRLKGQLPSETAAQGQ
jgi:flagellar biosynthetic protein FlhB